MKTFWPTTLSRFLIKWGEGVVLPTRLAIEACTCKASSSNVGISWNWQSSYSKRPPKVMEQITLATALLIKWRSTGCPPSSLLASTRWKAYSCIRCSKLFFPNPKFFSVIRANRLFSFHVWPLDVINSLLPMALFLTEVTKWFAKFCSRWVNIFVLIKGCPVTTTTDGLSNSRLNTFPYFFANFEDPWMSGIYTVSGLSTEVLLKHQVALLKVYLKEVAHKGQTPWPWLVVFWAMASEDASQEQEGDSSQQQSPEKERCPGGGHQGAQRGNHIWDPSILLCRKENGGQSAL